jgi:hypothetical protein
MKSSTLIFLLCSVSFFLLELTVPAMGMMVMVLMSLKLEGSQ